MTVDQNNFLKCIFTCIYKVLDLKEVVPKELCIESREYELIKQCCEWQSSRRPRLNKVNDTLQDILRLAGNCDFVFWGNRVAVLDSRFKSSNFYLLNPFVWTGLLYSL